MPKTLIMALGALRSRGTLALYHNISELSGSQTRPDNIMRHSRAARTKAPRLPHKRRAVRAAPRSRVRDAIPREKTVLAWIGQITKPEIINHQCITHMRRARYPMHSLRSRGTLAPSHKWIDYRVSFAALRVAIMTNFRAQTRSYNIPELTGNQARIDNIMRHSRTATTKASRLPHKRRAVRAAPRSRVRDAIPRKETVLALTFQKNKP